jgi:hypothetical protein
MNDILTALGSNYRIPNRFPTKVDSETTMGRVVVLTKVSHHLFFEDLADSGAAEFELEPATKNGFGPTDNFAPTSCAWPSPGAVFNVGNPFAGQADVRLTKVRVWMVGKESKLDHNVILVHLGKEQFRRSNDTPYPKRLDPPEQEDEDLRKSRYVVHEPVSIPFNYNAEGLSYDPDARSFTPGKLFGRRVGSQDGDLRFPKDGINDLPAAGEYAPIGPFGRWRLVVPKNLNPKLDLSELHAVVIDFHGFHQAYDQDLLR